MTRDATWRGEVTLAEDIVIARGVTLTIDAGTVIKVASSESTKIDPECLSPLVEITVRGHLEAEGETDRPIIFRGEGDALKDEKWAGIIIDGGNAWLRSVDITGAETAVTVVQGWAKLKKARLRGNTYGIVAQGDKSGVNFEDTDITDNDYGVMAFDRALVTDKSSRVEKNRKKDLYKKDIAGELPALDEKEKNLPAISRVYDDETLLGTTIWRGRVRVNGVVRVEMNGKLVISPGTIVEFGRRDTNGDGIGENALYIQGLLFAKGTPDKPILFRSAEKEPLRGDWDAINIMDSDRGQNVIEYCRIRDAYRGMHFHYANIVIRHSTLTHNYRGMQFQESLVDIANCRFVDNRSAIQARDSDVRFAGNEVAGNYSGANFFRLTMHATANRFLANRRDGVRVREGAVTLTNNVISRNRFGLLVSDAVHGVFNENDIGSNGETGLSLRNNDNIEIRLNRVEDNGISGMRIQDSRGNIGENNIARNGERGMGIVSFSGVISDNNIEDNGRYGIELEGASSVAAPRNWWGAEEPAKAVFDREDDPRLGKVDYEPVRETKIAVRQNASAQ